MNNLNDNVEMEYGAYERPEVKTCWTITDIKNADMYEGWMHLVPSKLKVYPKVYQGPKGIFFISFYVNNFGIGMFYVNEFNTRNGETTIKGYPQFSKKQAICNASYWAENGYK